MKKLFFILLAFFSTAAFSQNSNDAIVVFSGGVMRTMNIKSKPKETKGSVYYSDSWRTGNIYLFSGEIIKNYPLKYDLKKQEIEIQVDDDIKVIAVGAVKKVEWFNFNINSNEIFINCSSYDGAGKVGMYKVISDNKIVFLKKTGLKILESNYNQALDVGSQSNRYIKDDKYYISKNGKVKLIRKRKKQILKLFGDDAEKIQIFANENRLNFKKESDLSKIFNFYNSI